MCVLDHHNFFYNLLDCLAKAKIKKIDFLNKKPIMKSSSPFILGNRLLLCLCLLIASVRVSAQIISYDSVAEDNSRKDMLTFVEDFADSNEIRTIIIVKF